MQSLNIFIRDTLKVNLDDFEDLNKHESFCRQVVRDMKEVQFQLFAKVVDFSKEDIYVYQMKDSLMDFLEKHKEFQSNNYKTIFVNFAKFYCRNRHKVRIQHAEVKKKKLGRSIGTHNDYEQREPNQEFQSLEINETRGRPNFQHQSNFHQQQPNFQHQSSLYQQQPNFQQLNFQQQQPNFQLPTNFCQQQPNLYQLQTNFHKSFPIIEEIDDDESFQEESQFSDENIKSLCWDFEKLDI
ncbi:hypothetical protein M9Y10_009790 [Tritrichomonas musculus]|uniref:Uncharacterized protein n=1 Tax=Tritrichomonas musculus TaxID=1915356 RepID=A0ABR2IPD8_9EUKA